MNVLSDNNYLCHNHFNHQKSYVGSFFSGPVSIIVAFGIDKGISYSLVFILVFHPTCLFVAAKGERPVFCGTIFFNYQSSKEIHYQ